MKFVYIYDKYVRVDFIKTIRIWQIGIDKNSYNTITISYTDGEGDVIRCE